VWWGLLEDFVDSLGTATVVGNRADIGSIEHHAVSGAIAHVN
jgi:hypothetical protein